MLTEERRAEMAARAVDWASLDKGEGPQIVTRQEAIGEEHIALDVLELINEYAELRAQLGDNCAALLADRSVDGMGALNAVGFAIFGDCVERLFARTKKAEAHLAAMTTARDHAVEIAENICDTFTNNGCMRCQEIISVCPVEDIDALRAVGKETRVYEAQRKIDALFSYARIHLPALLDEIERERRRAAAPPTCVECRVPLGDSWCATCASRAAVENLRAVELEVERLRHGVAVEGDFVCPDSVEVERLRGVVCTIADEAFGPFPVQSAEDAATAIEHGIASYRRECERLRGVVDMQARATAAEVEAMRLATENGDLHATRRAR